MSTEEHIQECRLAAESGDANAQYQMGLKYAKGKVVAKDETEAATWYRKAAEQGHAKAQCNLGSMYESGRGVAKDEVEAVKWYRQSAEQGNDSAQWNLGWNLANGRGVDKDEVEAINWYRLAAEQGNSSAQRELGLMFENGRGVAKDEEEAVTWYRTAAEQGNSYAQSDLGRMLKNGRGVAKDDAEAAKWFRKSADQGSSIAQFELGCLYDNGHGVAKDETEAATWYRKAAEQGHAKSQWYLGWFLANGRGGLEKDEGEAVKWFRKASDQGIAEAQTELGHMYANGRGVTQDESEAVKWYRKAAEKGNARAQWAYGWYLANGRGVEKDETAAVAWYRKAAEQNYSDAQFELGRMYVNGRGVAKDAIEAVNWARKAAEQGNARGQWYYGWYLANGQGVAKDEEAAVAWYRKAADQGNSDAQCELGIMYANGRGVEQNVKEAIVWYRKAAHSGNSRAKELISSLATTNNEKHPEPVAEPRGERRETRTAAPSNQVKESRDCKSLLDASTPRVYAQNAFRITGLPVDAPARDIKRRIEDLKHAEENGDAEEEHNHAFAIIPPPSIEHIREAAQRLHDPERRLIEEFFWFWPSEWGKGNSDPSLLAMKNGDKDTAFKNWLACISVDTKSGVVSRGGGLTIRDQTTLASPREIAVAKHNLAVMHQLVALDSEHLVLENEVTAEQLETIEQYWRRCFKWWEELTEDETFWSLITERIRMYNEPERLKTGFARQMRASLPEAMDKINAMLAISYSACGKLALAENHIRYMKETHKGQDNIEKTLSTVTQPLKARIVSSVEKANNVAAREPKQAAKSAKELLQAVAEPVKIIKQILPPENHERIDLCDSIADACLSCQIAYARATKDWDTSLVILKDGAPYATSAETKKRIAENIATVTKNRLYAQHLDPLAKMIEKIEAKSTVAAKIQALENDVVPHLRKIKDLNGVTGEIYGECADLVSSFARALSVDAWNTQKDIDLCTRALNLAHETVQGADLKATLQQDRAQVTELRKSEEERRLYETCWFCKQSKATDTGKLEAKMYGDVTKTFIGNGTRTQWRNITIKVPRCDRCKEAHSKVGGKWAGVAAGAAAGTAFLPIFGTIIGAIAGGAIGRQVDQKMRLPPGVSAETIKSEFPLVKEWVGKGWCLGNGPT